MAERAKLFLSGGSQAVRLPKAYRFENQVEVRISREGERVILEPARRRWSRAFIDLSGTAPDFPYPDQPTPAEPGPDLD
jgi:antitoxin VapB